MSVKIVAELNPFSTERVKLTVEAKPIAEILKQLNSGLPLSQARVCRNGEIITDFSKMARDGDMLAVKFVPCGTPQQTGAGMKAGGWGLMILGIAALFIPVVGGFLGTALIGTGLSMALGGTVLMNINIPSLKDREKPENDPSIRGGKNQSRPGGRIPVLFGRHRIYPDLAANPHTQIIDGKQYLTQLFCGGYKDYIIDMDSFKLGETYLVDLSETKDINQILAGADPVIRLEILQNGEATSLYPHCVHEEALNAPLQKQIEDADGNMISGELTRTTPDNTDSINVDIFLHNGIGKYNANGDLVSASVEVKASYKSFGAPDSAYTLLGYFNNGSNVISGSELKTKRCQITKSGLARGKYIVKIERVTADSTDSKVIDQVYVGSIRSIKSERPIRPERQQNLTIIALRVLATSRLNGVLDSFNYVATAKMPVYSGNGSGALYWLNNAKTQNPASALLYALQGRAAQQCVDPDDIDWPSIEAFYTWCEDHDYSCNAYLSESVTIAELLRMIGSTARADILRIDSKISVVQDIERPSHMQLFTPKNSIGYSITMFNADVPDAVALRFIDEESGYAQNELQVYNTPDGNRVSEPDTVQRADLWGVTSSAQVRRIGMYNYGCMKNRPFVHTIEADIEYLICNKGDWIQYAGDVALTGSVQGRIKGVVWVDGVCVGIDTDEPVVMTEGKQHAVRIRKSDGSIILKDAIFYPGKLREKSITYYPSESDGLYEPFIGEMYAVDEDNEYYEPQNVIYFIEPLGENEAPKAGDIYAFGVRGYEALDLIITDIQPGQNFTAVLTCVEYSPEIFGVDDPGFILPEFVNRITPVSGAVDSGVVNPDRWKLFAAYHDGEEEPERPSGDGQGGGWHYAQTFRSIWQSTKMSESVESGEWGPPVRIRAERGNDDVTPIWLSLSPQNVTLETDAGGNLLAGLLPLTVQARLHKWNSVLTGVTFSLTGAPVGVSVNSSGVITVSVGVALNYANSITVRASYQGAVYTATLTITVNINSSAPRYLGTVDALGNTATVLIIKGTAPGSALARQGDYVLAVAPVNGQEAGSVFQWSGVAWEYRALDKHTDLYLCCYKDGLDEPELANNVEWFGGVIARLLIAQKGFIEALEVLEQTLKSPGFIQSESSTNGERDFIIKSNGEAIFNKATIRGHIDADSGTFNGQINAGSGVLGGVVIEQNSKFNGRLDCDSLIVDYDPSTIQQFPANGQYASNTPVSTIINDVYSRMALSTAAPMAFAVDGGDWDNPNGGAVKAIEFYRATSANNVTGIRITTTKGTASFSGNINGALWFRLGSGLKKIRLVGLPNAPSGTAGTVYRESDGYGNYLLKLKS